MITPAVAFEGIRAQLRERVLPDLDDEATRSVVFAILGTLRDLELQVRADDEWCRVTAQELSEALPRWKSWVAGDAHVAAALDRHHAAAASAKTPREARAELLGGAELVVRTLWQQPTTPPDVELADLRALLAADLARQLERTT